MLVCVDFHYGRSDVSRLAWNERNEYLELELMPRLRIHGNTDNLISEHPDLN